MINFIEAVKHHLLLFVETGHSKPVHLMQNYLINDIYHAIDNKQMVMLTSNQRTYKGYINRYDSQRQAIFIEQDKVISMIELKDIKRLKIISQRG
ncbi:MULTISPECIES: hypothetical protein [Streptococcus]|uniref:Uncharacterized protein n=1 Tax=Streptococcus thermophilus TaxID=1308 RepID=A0A7U7H2F4_STRTR|nr:hypothetical protein [Streptococcus thermophilus]CAD0137013.1 conserved protein of unknown function [Streptococcus thermophilus]CAD0143019.1 conserved protein of unknown function [Streptococcus thermophilus]CAD0144336.1 conserved protein of unknown function [Streptococcus thermophilus]CAD0148009.1 conserved protein of unknown function [Streptococcus thermophilus]CAD0149723.1 conserved protein of unknown function [Streptococcus thermophilus]